MNKQNAANPIRMLGPILAVALLGSGALIGGEGEEQNARHPNPQQVAMHKRAHRIQKKIQLIIRDYTENEDPEGAQEFMEEIKPLMEDGKLDEVESALNERIKELGLTPGEGEGEGQPNPALAKLQQKIQLLAQHFKKNGEEGSLQGVMKTIQPLVKEGKIEAAHGVLDRLLAKAGIKPGQGGGEGNETGQRIQRKFAQARQILQQRVTQLMKNGKLDEAEALLDGIIELLSGTDTAD